MARVARLSSVSIPRDVDDWAQIETREDFVAYLQLLAVDFEADERELVERRGAGHFVLEGRWAHGSVAAVLDAWAAWLQDTQEDLEPLTWRSLALQLSAARVYE
jgi:hypothetical protein